MFFAHFFIVLPNLSKNVFCNTMMQTIIFEQDVLLVNRVTSFGFVFCFRMKWRTNAQLNILILSPFWKFVKITFILSSILLILLKHLSASFHSWMN